MKRGQADVEDMAQLMVELPSRAGGFGLRAPGLRDTRDDAVDVRQGVLR